MNICYNHPAIEAQLNKGQSGSTPYNYPIGHPTLQSFFAPLLPGDHGNVDSLLRSGRKYGSSHPNMDNYVTRLAANVQCYDFSSVRYPPSGQCPTAVGPTHPAIDAAINNAATVFPSNHIKTQPLLLTWMPSTHRWVPFSLLSLANCVSYRDIDMLMASKIPLPVGHPSMDPYVCQSNSSLISFLQGHCPVSVSIVHPPIDAAINNATLPFPLDHPLMQTKLAPYMPTGHGYAMHFPCC